MNLPPSRNGRARSGATLIIVLALITIVSILLLAYLATVQFERNATQSYSGALTADQIAVGGLDRQIADLQQEIIAGSTSNGDPNPGAPAYYKPNANACMAPARYTDAASANYTNLIRVSTGSTTIYNAAFPPAYYTASQVPVDLATTNSTVTPSPDGRYISATRWGKPQLMLRGETMPTPDWILMTRVGPTNAAGLGFGASGNTLNNASPSNPNFVQGRYAYAIYDEGGLLDATVAGVTGSVPTADDTGNRGSLALAPLTNAIFTPAQIGALAGWRNPVTDASEANYTNYVYNVAATNGFLQVQQGDNTFLNRQDLIAYANYAGLTASLPYLGTFSRDVNAPAYIPPATTLTTTPAGANPDPLMIRRSTTGTVNGASTGSYNLLKSRTVNAGDFLVSRRFSLNRLAWITYSRRFPGLGPAAGAAAGKGQDQPRLDFSTRRFGKRLAGLRRRLFAAGRDDSRVYGADFFRGPRRTHL